MATLSALSQNTMRGLAKAASTGQTTTKRTVSRPAQTSGNVISITNISFANADQSGSIITDYGNDLYASEIKYLKPQITYNGLRSTAVETTLLVKIITDDGTLESSSSSPEGYTFSTELTVSPGEGQTATLSGWGRNTCGSYSAGLYKYEIWQNGKLLIQQKIRLLSGSTPIAENRLMKISSVSYANQDYEGNVLAGFGDNLYAGEVQYVTAKIRYNCQYTTAQKVTLYYRYFDPDGSLINGSTSPTGFTSKSSIDVQPGQNTITLPGYGSSTGNSYPEGSYIAEYWIDGEKIYQTSFEVKKKSSTYSTVTSSESAKILKSLLTYPMGHIKYDIETASPQTILRALQNAYKVDDSSQDGESSYYLWKSDNELSAMAYKGLPPYYFLYYNSNSTQKGVKGRIKYSWEFKKTIDPYKIMDEIIEDFNSLGISISYQKSDDEYTKAKGSISIGEIKYNIELNDYGAIYQLNIDKWIFNR